jgi:(aminoalkyl)phosphonate N-acetyltransferase
VSTVSSQEIQIREMQIDDAEAAASLSGELGYPVEAAVMAGRIRAVKALPDHAAFVAILPEHGIVGWIDISVMHHLQAERYVDIGGLVVSSVARSLGVGRQLVARAEEWARGRGIKTMFVRSQIKRDRAHRFYLREGYRQIKTSAVFSKEL